MFEKWFFMRATYGRSEDLSASKDNRECGTEERKMQEATTIYELK